VISGRDVLVISNVDWHPLWQAPQEIATRLGRAGNRVVFLENTGIRAPRPSDAGRVARRLGSWALEAGHRRPPAVAPGVLAHSPLVLPPFGSRVRRSLNRRMFLPAVRRLLGRLEFRDPIVIAFLPSDTTLTLYEMLRTPSSVLVYYNVADFTQLAPDVEAVEAGDRRLAAEADVLLAGSSELGRRVGTSRPVHAFPPSVNMELFPADAPVIRVADGPVVGYVGGIHRHLDVDLLGSVAERRPDWTLVLLGPLQQSCEALLRRPNVRHLGAKAHDELASYIAGFDAAVVPYVRNSQTETVIPAKIGEYLAMGKPVVSTDLPAVRELAADPGVVAIADGPGPAFARAVARALEGSGDAELVSRRRELAARFDSRGIAERIGLLIEAAADDRAPVTRLPRPEVLPDADEAPAA
jgi:glycosyltransferase involved in cell wall biosynthesis